MMPWGGGGGECAGRVLDQASVVISRAPCLRSRHRLRHPSSAAFGRQHGGADRLSGEGLSHEHADRDVEPGFGRDQTLGDRRSCSFPTSSLQDGVGEGVSQPGGVAVVAPSGDADLQPVKIGAGVEPQHIDGFVEGQVGAEVVCDGLFDKGAAVGPPVSRALGDQGSHRRVAIGMRRGRLR